MIATEFLDALFHGTKGYIGIYSNKRTKYFATTDTTNAAAHAQGLSETGLDVYVCVCPRREVLDNLKRGGEYDVDEMQAFWADIDFGTLGHKAVNCPPTVEDALSLLEGLPKPSITVNSSGGLHCYWLLRSPIPAQEGKEINRALQKHIARNADLNHWHADAGCFNPAWMLRIPGTYNYKEGQKRPVSVIGVAAKRYVAEDFAHLELEGSVRTRLPTVKVAHDAVQARPTLAPEKAREALVQKLKTVKRKEEHKALVNAVLKGEALAEPGSRDVEMNRLAAIVSRMDPDSDPEDLIEVFTASLEATGDLADCDKDPIDNFLEKLARHQWSARHERAQEEEEKKQFLESAARAARASVGDVVSESVSAMYSVQEIEQWAASQDCSVADFEKRWIIQRGDIFFVFVAGRYLSPVQRSELAISLPRDLAPAPIEWEIWGAKGPRPKKVDELLKDYCTVARNLRADMTITESYYDPEDQSFVEAVCRRRNISPVYHAKIDTWLRLFAGNEAEKFLDWIATVTMLERQNSALYCCGDPNTGKTMLASGLARLWTKGSPTDLDGALSSFNDSLIQCPLIFGDEKIPQNFRGQRDSAELRQLIAVSQRKLKRKFMPICDLVGAIRLILAANNDMLLNFEEQLSAWDQKAVAGRFLFIETPKAASEYLESLGGRRGTDGWVDKDMIAEHALWLKETRQVLHGSRFLVEGDSSTLSEMLATQGKWPSLVLEWICRHLDQPKQMVNPLIIVGNGRLLVNSTTMVDSWDSYIKSDRAPSAALIGRTLSNLSTGATQEDGIRYHELNVTMLLAWAKKNQVGDASKLKAKIDGPVLKLVRAGAK